MNTAKEIYDYLKAKHPGRKIEVAHNFYDGNMPTPEYFTCHVDGCFSCTSAERDIAGMIADAERNLLTPAQEREKLLQAFATAFAAAKAVELAAGIAELDRKLNPEPPPMP